MSNINEYLDNRELAILVWLTIIFIWALSNKSIRESISEVIKTLFNKVILFSTSMMLFYIGLMVYIFHRLGLWDATLLSETIIWFVGVAFVMYINISRV